MRVFKKMVRTAALISLAATVATSNVVAALIAVVLTSLVLGIAIGEERK